MFGVEMWFNEIVEYKLQMGWQWERRPLHHLLGLRYLAKRSLREAVEKLFSSPWFWFLKYSAFFFFIFSFSLRAPCFSDTAQFVLAKPWKVWNMFSHFTGGEWQHAFGDFSGKKKNNKDFKISWVSGSAVKPSSLCPGSQSVNGLVNRLMATVKQEINQGDVTEWLKIHKIKKPQTLLVKPQFWALCP